MPSVDEDIKFVGEFLVASGVLFFRIESWTHGTIGWGIASCFFGYAFVFRKFFAERLALFTTPTP
jgi:hypothetical protein